jgi:hypothetical protein
MSSLPVCYHWSEFLYAVALKIDRSRLRRFDIRRKDTSVACATYGAARRSMAGFAALIVVKNLSSPTIYCRGLHGAPETIIA